MTDGCSAVLVFSKTPVPGTVKTRLLSELGEEGVAELYESLISRTIAIATGSGVGDVELWCWPTTEHSFLQECVSKFQIALESQQGSSLGERMHNAFERRLSQYDQVVVIGCDVPEVVESDIQSAVSELRSGADVVLGPAEDGGYYLIGLRVACGELFSGIEWSGSGVLEATQAVIDRLGLKCVELIERWDLDRPDDLARYNDLP